MNMKLLKTYLPHCVAGVFIATAVVTLFSNWADSLFGGKELVKATKDVFVYLLLFLTVIYRPTIIKQLWSEWFNKLAIGVALLNVILALLAANDIDARAAGLLFNTRYLAWFLLIQAVLFVSSTAAEKVFKPVFVSVAVFMVGLGVLQATLLPKNFLSFFGYELAGGRGYQALDANPEIIRVMATARGPNELGAFVMVVLVLFAVKYFHTRKLTKYEGVFLSLALVALYFTYSRSATIGLVIGLSVVALRYAKNKRVVVWSLLAAAALGVLLLVATFRVPALQTAIFHTEFDDILEDGSDIERIRAQRRAFSTIADNPLGQGPGTAGTASFYQDKGSQITENYYLQLAIEIGVMGVLLFVALLVFVGKELYRNSNSPLGVAAFATLMSFAFIGLFLHMWTDDLSSYTWWGLAALGLQKK